MESLPSVIGRYEIRERLGQGGMGVLYLAFDPAMHRLVALKLLRVNDDSLRERFLREARLVARLQHPNIITIYDVNASDDPYMTMEYVAGETVDSLIRRHAPLPLTRKLELMIDLCDALAYAHRMGVIHRDVKPSNLMVHRDSGLLRVLDFGIARSTDSKLTLAGAIMGTPNYMSPEQIEGRPVDHRSDIFAVGAVCYELLTGRQAFSGDTPYAVLKQIVHEPPQPLVHADPALDPALQEIADRAMAKEPDARYPDLDHMRRDLSIALLRTRAHSTADTIVVAPIASRSPAARTESSAHLSVPPAAPGTADAAGSAPPAPRGSVPPPTLDSGARQTPSAAYEAATVVTPRTESAVREPVVRDSVRDRAARELAAGAPARPVSMSREDAPPALSAPEGPWLLLDEGRTWAARWERWQRPLIAFGVAAALLIAVGALVLGTSRLGRNDPVEPTNPAPTRAQGTPTTPTPSDPQAARTQAGAGQLSSPSPSSSALTGSPAVPQTTAPIAPPTGAEIAQLEAERSAAAGAATPAPTTLTPAQPAQAQPQGQSTSPNAPPSSIAPAPAVDVPRAERRRSDPGIQQTLTRWAGAYSSLDVLQIVRVWPTMSAEQGKRLQSSFKQMSSYSMSLDGCSIAYTTDRASATCSVARAIVYRNGREMSAPGRVTVQLEKRESRWVIVNVQGV